MYHPYHITFRSNSGKKKFKELTLQQLPLYEELETNVRKLFRIKKNNNKQSLTLYLDVDIPQKLLSKGTKIETNDITNIYLEEENCLKTRISVALDNETYQAEIHVLIPILILPF